MALCTRTRTRTSTPMKYHHLLYQDQSTSPGITAPHTALAARVCVCTRHTHVCCFAPEHEPAVLLSGPLSCNTTTYCTRTKVQALVLPLRTRHWQLAFVFAPDIHTCVALLLSMSLLSCCRGPSCAQVMPFGKVRAKRLHHLRHVWRRILRLG